MSEIKYWSETAATNGFASPDGAADNWKPSVVNEVYREGMSAIRKFYGNLEWRVFADATGTGDCHVASYVDATSFSIPNGEGNQTGLYEIGRRVKVNSATPGDIYGTITNSVWTTITTVTVNWDSTEMTSEAITVSLGVGVTGGPVNKIGTAGQHLVSDGTSFGPVSGAWEHVETASFTTETTLYMYHDTISDTASGTNFIDGWEYRLLFDGLYGTDQSGLSFELYEGAGYRSGTNEYLRYIWGMTTTTDALSSAGTVSTFGSLTSGWGNSQTLGQTGWMEFRNTASTSQQTSWEGLSVGVPTSSNRTYHFLGRAYTTNLLLAAKHIRFSTTSGDVTGQFKLFRRKAA